MRSLRISKVTLNFGAGKNPQLLERGMRLLEKVAGKPPVQTKTQKRIPNWNLRPGLPIGAKITLRGKRAEEVLATILTAKHDGLTTRNFDKNGNLSFGVPEYVEISGMKYDPEIGMLGFEASVTIERPGFRIKRRRIFPKHIPASHQVTKEESIAFVTEKYGITVT
jgi:large subunit ribosomal protein L5